MRKHTYPIFLIPEVKILLYDTSPDGDDYGDDYTLISKKQQSL